MADLEQTLQPETLDFIFEQSREVPDTQMRTAEALDAKTVQVFAAATVVIGLAAAGGIRGHASVGWLVAAAVAYLVALVAAITALDVRDFRTNTSPTELWEKHWQDGVHEIKHALVSDLAEGYRVNDSLLNNKAKGFKVALIATGVESALVAVALIVSLA